MNNNGNTALYALIAIIVIIGIVCFSYFGIYNSLVGLDNGVENKWADVEVQYNRRADLVPQIVNSTKGYMQFEKTVLENVTKARSGWQNAQTTEEKITAGTELDGAIGRLLLVFENYPELKASEIVRDLMVQLEGTENRIAVARRDYNDVVRQFNNAIRMFPSNIVAGMTGFTEPKEFFEAKEGSDIAPVVDLEVD